MYTITKSIECKIIKKLVIYGISKHKFDIWKIYNPNGYDKLIKQGQISVKIAVYRYKDVIKRHYRVYC